MIGIHGILRDPLLRLGVEDVHIGAVALGHPDLAILVDHQVVNALGGIGRDEFEILAGARVEAAKAVGSIAVGDPDEPLLIEDHVLADAALAPGSGRRRSVFGEFIPWPGSVGSEIALDVFGFGDFGFVDRHFARDFQAARLASRGRSSAVKYCTMVSRSSLLRSPG